MDPFVPRAFAAARRLLLPALLLALAGCAAGTPPGGDPTDPFEATNRGVLDVNLAVDDAVIRPVAEGYRAAVPQPVRQGLHNAFRNLDEPRILANNLLQGRLLDAGHTLMRFFINSTAGIGGLIDVATPSGIERRSGDFGQTLHSWGVGDGPFLMLPLLGPSNPRDAVGLLGDALASPLLWLAPPAATAGVAVGAGVDARERNIENLDILRQDSLDFYARLRSVWRQNRAAELGAAVPAADAGDGSGEGLTILEDPGAR